MIYLALLWSLSSEFCSSHIDLVHIRCIRKYFILRVLRWMYWDFNFKLCLFIAGLQTCDWFLHIHLVSWNLALITYSSQEYFCWFFQIFYIDNVSPANKDSIYSLSICTLYIFSCFLIAWAEASTTMLKRSEGTRHPCLCSDLRNNF